MNQFDKVESGLHVDGLMSKLLSNPHLWDKNPCRLSMKGPHHETQDIFLRYKDETENLRADDWSNFSDPHLPEWYESINHLPEARPLIFNVMHKSLAEMLGGVFIYKVQPGKRIYPHKDNGWHPEYFDKFNVCLQSNPQAAFCYDEARMIQEPGDVHWFRNDIRHWVVNEGTTDHVVMTVCVRVDKGYRVPWSPEGWHPNNRFATQEA